MSTRWRRDELLDFVDELPEWVEDAPLLILCTARPELLDQRPGWGGGKRNATTISLSPLASDETAQLLASLLDRPLLPAETQAELLMRAGGNPLYADFAASRLGIAGDFRERVRPFGRGTRWDRAAEAVLDGRWVDAADAYDEIGTQPFAALAALRATQTFVEEGRRAEADEQLHRALAFYRSVGATRYIREGESLLAASA
jgi:hypothetical protein